MVLRVGTSGWQYADWRGPVYPKGEPQRRWLALYTELFDTVEVNNTFYRLPDPTRFRAWHDETPDDFCFAVKASRYLTHIRRLRAPADSVHRLMRTAVPLGDKQGPVLVQLPPNLSVDVANLDRTLRAFPSSARVAVEFRHDSWDVDEVDQVLTSYNASCVLADDRGRITGRRTADWAYVRLHRGRASPSPCYGLRALQSWVGRIVDLWGPQPDGYVYFNNDPGACAVRNATTFRNHADRVGVAV